MQAKLPKLEAADEPAGDGEWWVTSVNKGPIDTVIVIRSGDTVTAKRVADAIAAAPDLLRHCQTMLSWWEKNPDVLKRFPTLAIDEIRAAIRKAQGGAA